MSEDQDPNETDETAETAETTTPSWVPQSAPVDDELTTPSWVPQPSVDDDASLMPAETEEAPPQPVDDSATKSFPPPGPLNPPRSGTPVPPPAAEPPPQFAAPEPPPQQAIQPPPQQYPAPPQQPPAQQQPAAQPPAQPAPPAQQPPPQQFSAPQPPAQQPQQPAAQQPQQFSTPQPPVQQPPPQQYSAPQPPAQQPAQQPQQAFQQPGSYAPPGGQQPQAYAQQSPASSPSYAPPQGPPPGGFGPAPQSGGRSKGPVIVGLGVLLALIGGAIAFVVTRDSGTNESADGQTISSDDGDDGTASQTDDDTTSGDTTGTVTADAMPANAEDLARSVVQIQLLLEGEPVCTGSGTIVDTIGTVVTNFHVVAQSPLCPHDTIGVAVAETSQAVPTLSYEADLLAFDSELDLAVIRIARDLNGGAVTDVFEAVEVGDSDLVSLGDELSVIGFPGIGGDTVTFTTGSVSGFAETVEGGERSWLKTDATITGGNSGGLAADSDGRFVGVPTRAGSGSGQIVDCRVIADSNGDGQLNSEDSCVPIGGFINGIRPVGLALPLIESAATATPIDQGPPEREAPMSSDLPSANSPTWTSSVTDQGTATDSLIAGVAGLTELCLTWDYTNVPTGTLTDAVWLYEAESVPEASVFDLPNSGEIDGSFFACITLDEGLPPGTYELAWLVDKEIVFSEGIILGDGATATVEIIHDSDVPLCVVQLNPTGTTTFGLNELSEPLEPGRSIRVDVGQGGLDARAINCEGDIRLEDSSGFEITDDLEVAVN